MSALFISIAIIVVAIIMAICFLVSELFWPIVAIIVLVLLWKLVSQRMDNKTNCNIGDKPFEEEKN